MWALTVDEVVLCFSCTTRSSNSSHLTVGALYFSNLHRHSFAHPAMYRICLQITVVKPFFGKRNSPIINSLYIFNQCYPRLPRPIWSCYETRPSYLLACSPQPKWQSLRSTMFPGLVVSARDQTSHHHTRKGRFPDHVVSTLDSEAVLGRNAGRQTTSREYQYHNSLRSQ